MLADLRKFSREARRVLHEGDCLELSVGVRAAVAFRKVEEIFVAKRHVETDVVHSFGVLNRSWGDDTSPVLKGFFASIDEESSGKEKSCCEENNTEKR